MTDEVRDSYDAMAERYTALALGDLDRIPSDRDWLAAFAELARSHPGAVADLGCGPGHVVHHLTELGLTVTGSDITPGLIAAARRTFPDLSFRVGDLSALDVADASLGGIVSRYSPIHMLPDPLGSFFWEWRRAREPGAPVLVSFFAAPSAEAHGAPFDHAVVTAYQLHPDKIAGQLQDAGFGGVEIGMRSPLEGERPLDHGTVLARKPIT
ncbi:MAG: class I SAM-dependent methyltransferase [Acidimicrobiales bacterium]